MFVQPMGATVMNRVWSCPLPIAALSASRSRPRVSRSTHRPGYEFRCENPRSRLRSSTSSAILVRNAG